MSLPAQTYQEEQPRIKKAVDASRDYSQQNNNRYHEFRKFVFDTSITERDKGVLNATGKPDIECNIIEAFISRLRGEFSKQEPSITVKAADGQNIPGLIVNTVEGYMRSLLFDANNDSFEYDVYTDLLSGGFSAIKVWTEYENESSFNQVIRIGRPFDVTMVGFDPMARKPHKGDGRFCWEMFPKTKEEFQVEHPNVDLSKLKFFKEDGKQPWSYKNDDEDVLLICDYYEKKKKKAKLFKLADGRSMLEKDYQAEMEKWTDAIGKGLIIVQPPAVIDKRNTEVETICRYRIIEDQVIEYVETDYKYLPLIFVDGNSVLLKPDAKGKAKQMTRPYAYQARDLQRLKNFAMQTLGNELENLVQHKLMMSKQSIVPEFADAITNYQIPNVIIYDEIDPNDATKRLSAPQMVVRPQIPVEIQNTFSMADQSMQMVLGSYDASLGINNNQLSGVAIVEGATQSNAAAMPYVVGFMKGLNQAAQIIVDLIPKYYKTARTLSVMNAQGKQNSIQINQPGALKLEYPSNALHVRVEAGVNFAIQKSRALQQMTGMMQASPLFAQFMNQEGLEELLDNMEFRGVDQLKQKAVGFMQQLKQQQAMAAKQPNPQVMKVQLEQQKFAADQQQNQIENQQKNVELAIDQQNANVAQMKVAGELSMAQEDNQVQMNKANVEAFAKMADLTMSDADQKHRHAKETVELAHMISQPQQPKGENTSA